MTGVMLTSVVAQCVMCFRTAAAQQAERSRVLNHGIVALIIPPFVVLGVVGYMAWRKSGAVSAAKRVTPSA